MTMEKESFWKKIEAWFLTFWWTVPALLVLMTFVSTFAMIETPESLLEELAVLSWLVIALLHLPVLVLLLIRRKWIRGIVMLVLSLVILPISLFTMATTAVFAPDAYAKRHPIPQGLKYEIPYDNLSAEVGIDSSDTNSYLQIWRTGGGSYAYDFYYHSLPAGTIFLRCFEAGTNDPLSEKTIADYSAVGHSASTFFSQIVTREKFTIYEGDWDEYYAARVEVWHRDSLTQQEQKLLEKYYLVDGYMR